MATAQPAEKKIESTANQVADVRVDVPYEVRDHATYNIPAICTCCLAPTENRYAVGWSETHKYSTTTQRITETHRASMEFCICPDCAEHRREYERKRMRMIILSVLLSSIVSSLLIFIFDAVLEEIFGGGFLFFLVVMVLVPIVMALPALATLDILIPQRALDQRHASRLAGARMVSPHHFEFDNLVYAQLFEKMNGEGVKYTDPIGNQHDLHYTVTKTIKNPVLHYKVMGKSLLEGSPLFELLLITSLLSVVLTFLVSLALYVTMRDPSMAGKPGSYVCSSVLLLVVISIVLEEWRKT